MSGVEHYPTQVGATMGGSYTGKYITCSCQADKYGDGPKIPARDYPAHIIGAVASAGVLGRVVDVAQMSRGFGVIEATHLHVTVEVDLGSPIAIGDRVVITGEVPS